MKIFRSNVVLAACLIGAMLTACVGGNKNANTNSTSNTSNASNSLAENANTAKTNVEELGLLINVPYVAEDIAWKEDAAHKKVMAVFRFLREDANKIVAEAEKYGAAENVSVAVETWFPDELIAQGEMSGDNALRGTAYPADGFYLEPYTTGKITRIEGGDYFVLELSAK